MKNYWLDKKYKGFLQGDERSIQCDYGGSANLDIFYNSPFVQNETAEQWLVVQNYVEYGVIEYTPVLPATLTGVVYYDSQPVQTFFAKRDGSFEFNPIDTPSNYIKRGSINHCTGVISTTWNSVPPSGKTKLVIDYEYNMEF